MLTLAELLAARPVVKMQVDLPELGPDKFVYVTTMNGQQRDELEGMFAKSNSQLMRQKVVAWCVCDEDGKPFAGNGKDIAAANSLPSGALNRIFCAGMKMSGMPRALWEDEFPDETGDDNDLEPRDLAIKN